MLKGHVFKNQVFESAAFAHFINTFLRKNSGITKGCNLSNTTNSVTISDGFFCLAGRLLEIIGNETVKPTANGYYRLVCDVNLSLINTKEDFEQAKIKVLYDQNKYPELNQQDLDNGGEIYQYEFASFRINNNEIVDFIDKRTFINLDDIFDEIRTQGNKEINKIEEELNNIKNNTSVVLKNNFVTIQGKINIDAQVTGSASISYPEEFDFENTVFISCGLSVIDKNGYNYIGSFENSGDIQFNAYTRRVNLRENDIYLSIANPSNSTKTVQYKITIMKK